MKNKFLISLGNSLNLIWVTITSILVGCAATTMETGTRAILRPDLTEDDSEIWQISSKGNDITNVEYNAMVRAAYTSRKEGKDCFIILDSKADEKKYYYVKSGTKTLSGHSSYYGSDGSYVRGHTTYEVPTTDSLYLGKDKTADMYVIFLNQESCNTKKESKWRNNIYYNDSVIEHYERKKTSANGKTSSVQNYTKSDGISKNNAEAYYDRGTAYYGKKNYDRAVSEFTEAIRLKPDFAMAYSFRGLAYSKKGYYDRAIADHTEAIRLNPNYTAYSGRGSAYCDKKDYDKAISDFSEAIRLNPNYAMAYFFRGLAHSRKGDYDRAIADYESVLQIDPNDSEAQNALENIRGMGQ